MTEKKMKEEFKNIHIKFRELICSIGDICEYIEKLYLLGSELFKKK